MDVQLYHYTLMFHLELHYVHEYIAAISVIGNICSMTYSNYIYYLHSTGIIATYY